MREYVVWTPNYTQRSAGVRATHLLVDALNKAGQRAFVTAHVRHEGLITPRWDGTLTPETVVVYPEIVNGNPFHGRRVVRWLLRPNGAYVQGDDLVVVWSKAFLDQARISARRELSEEDVLMVPVVETEYFHPVEVKERALILAYQVDVGRYGLPDGTVMITEAWPETRAEMATLFRMAKYLICGDPMTALADEARFCGCPVYQLTPSPWKVWDYGSEGMFWKMSEIEKAVKEAPISYAKYLDYVENEMKRQLEIFIERTQA